MTFTIICKTPSAYSLPEVPTATIFSAILKNNEVLEISCQCAGSIYMHTTTKDRRLHRIEEMILGSVWSTCMTETDDLQYIKKLNKPPMNTQLWAQQK